SSLGSRIALLRATPAVCSARSRRSCGRRGLKTLVDDAKEYEYKYTAVPGRLSLQTWNKDVFSPAGRRLRLASIPLGFRRDTHLSSTTPERQSDTAHAVSLSSSRRSSSVRRVKLRLNSAASRSQASTATSG